MLKKKSRTELPKSLEQFDSCIHTMYMCKSSFSHIEAYMFFNPFYTGYFDCTVKPVLSSHSKRRPNIGFQDRLSLKAGQKYCRMLQGEHSAILLTFIKLSFVIKYF